MDGECEKQDYIIEKISKVEESKSYKQNNTEVFKKFKEDQEHHNREAIAKLKAERQRIMNEKMEKILLDKKKNAQETKSQSKELLSMKKHIYNSIEIDNKLKSKSLKDSKVNILKNQDLNNKI